VKSVRVTVIVLVLIVAVIAGGSFYAPGFLLYQTRCSKSDVIVLLLGPQFNARQRHALELMKNGMSEHLIIPAYHKVYRMDAGDLKLLYGATREEVNQLKINKDLPSYYEDTHIELIEAKKIMKQYAWSSAIFVSSPYHMRRIRVIVQKEFNRPEHFFFSPTPYEGFPASIWDFKTLDWKRVYREYLKIIWFSIYSVSLTE
jgi:hypothetical protein